MAHGAPKTLGFTLIELIFVAIALGILLVSTAPSFRRSFDKIKLEQAAFSIAQSLRCARSIAVSQSQALRWKWDKEKRSSVILALNEDGALESKMDFRMCEAHLNEPITLAFSDESLDDLAVNFFPDGTSDALSLRIFGLGKNIYEIDIDGPSAQVRLKQKSFSSN
jgi:type II secretory pathway pseudopilin PulG